MLRGVLKEKSMEFSFEEECMVDNNNLEYTVEFTLMTQVTGHCGLVTVDLQCRNGPFSIMISVFMQRLTA